jgi:hypothetical protein
LAPALTIGVGCKDWWLLLKLRFVLNADDEGLAEGNDDEKTKARRAIRSKQKHDGE